jgi:hypothetical protein
MTGRNYCTFFVAFFSLSLCVHFCLARCAVHTILPHRDVMLLAERAHRAVRLMIC